MARRYIKIASPDGTNTVNLYDYKLKLPDPFPEIKYKNGNKEYQMRNTSSGRGNRVWKSVGNGINHGEISFIAHSLTNAEMGNLILMSNARPNVVLISLNSGTTRYFAIFDELTPMGYQNNENPSTGLAFFLKAEISVKFLQTTTQAFGG